MKRLALAFAVMAVVGVLALLALGGCGGSGDNPGSLGDGQAVTQDGVAAPASADGASDDVAAAAFGRNVIANGGAEMGTGGNGYVAVAIPKWSKTGALTVVTYGSPGFPTNASPGPASRGKNFFAGGPNSALSVARQTVDVSWAAPVIDVGDARYVLAGFLGGWSYDGDNAKVKLTFLDAGSGKLGSATIGPVTAAERSNVTGTIGRSKKGLLPGGTRSIKVELIVTRMQGGYNDGYADALSLKLTDRTPL